MLDAPQQPSQPRSSAGFRPLVSFDLSKGLGNSPTACVAAAAGLGLVIGVTIAFTAGHASAAAPRVSDALSTHTSGLSAVPAVYAATTSSLLNQVDTKKKAGTGSPLLSRVSEKSVKKAAGSHKKHPLHRIWSWKKGVGKNGAHRRPYVSPTPVAVPNAPTGLELATAAAAAGPFYLGIEGDVTIANYDAGTGAIQTYEGSNFLLAKAGEPSAIPWQDYPLNVHYRCDEAGNCTLVHHGAMASARLAR